MPLGEGQQLQVEFVSANPVGPIHVGNGRGLALGDTLARVLAAAGYEVQREYLVNDAGTQTEIFAATLYARYQQLFGREVEIREGGYPGEYMIELAEGLKGRARRVAPGPARRAATRRSCTTSASQRMLDVIRDDLARSDVHYDNWFSERSVYSDTAPTRRRWRSCASAATWRSARAPSGSSRRQLGEEKDNVLVRSTGAPTYFASDIAYHYDKFVLRGFERVINVWGADHQGHVPRMKAAVSALGVDPERLTIIIYQLVTLKRGAEVVKLSKRAGEIITLREVVEEVGADAVRFYFVGRAADSHMDFDIELAKRQSAENPVYYVQYAHARIAGILIAGGGARHRLRGRRRLAARPTRRSWRSSARCCGCRSWWRAIARSLEPHQLPVLRDGAGDGVPRLLREVPRGLRRRGAVEGAAEAGARRRRWCWRGRST